MRNLLLLSSSHLHGYDGFLTHCLSEVLDFYKRCNAQKVLFVPYASLHHDAYAAVAKNAFDKIGLEMDSIHEYENPIEAVGKAQGIFIGGGNTFLLLKTLYDKELVEPLRKRVMQDGIPYMGSSAGSNVSTVSINTTNDMPIIFPPSFKALNLVPFNINPHFVDADPNSNHKGETRERRINEYHDVGDNPPVLGLREGTRLEVAGEVAVLHGKPGAKLFSKNKEPVEYFDKADLSFLLQI